MEEIVFAVTKEMAAYWRALAHESAVPLEEWIALNCGFVAVMGIPIREVVLRQPPAERELKGVAWELGKCRDLRSPNGCEVPDPRVPIVDVRTEIRRKSPW